MAMSNKGITIPYKGITIPYTGITMPYKGIWYYHLPDVLLKHLIVPLIEIVSTLSTLASSHGKYQ